MIVAIDGPAGSGKSTVASALARKLGFRHLDTGAMYRALAWLVPRVARHSEVREVMRGRQRALGLIGDSVIEGRDIGTVVVPDADVKVFLLADEGERARRRTGERPGVAAETLAADLRKRDEHDAVNTLPAPDAVVLDTTTLTADDVVQRIAELVGERR